MSRRIVITCDRCPCEFDAPPPADDDPAEGPVTPHSAALVWTFGDEVVRFDDLCPKCDNAVGNLIAKIRLKGDKEPSA